MDCGPASLKCLLEGFGISVSYDRLREACQTDVDGTSIDTIEEAAVLLGLEAEQIMVPVDHVLLAEARTLPCVAVVRLPNGNTHFVVAWRYHRGLVQVMDPATGRRWPGTRRFLDEIYVHTRSVPAGAWREWAASEESMGALRRRLTNLGVSERFVTRIVNASLEDPAWRSVAALEAALQMTASIARSGALRDGQEVARVLEHFFERARTEEQDEDQIVASEYWPVLPAEACAGAEDQLLLRGAVLLRVRGRRARRAERPADGSPQKEASLPPLSPELVAALKEPPSRTGRDLLQLLRADGLLAPAMLAAALFISAGGVLIEAVLFRGLFDLGRDLGLAEQRFVAIGALLVFVSALLLLELPVAAVTMRLGRHLEVRLRVAFLEKLSRLNDRYFHSRLVSDMAERSHSVPALRLLPGLGAQLIGCTFELVLTTAGLIWLDPASATLALLAALLGVGLPLIAQPAVGERDLRVRSHAGALSIFYLDALLGLIPVRTHAAERTVRRNHEELLAHWARAGLALQRAVLAIEGVQLLTGFGLAAWLLFDHLARSGETGGTLLFVYWALSLPFLGQEVALVVRQYPARRNVTLRLLEPLGAPDPLGLEPRGASVPPSSPAPARTRGVAVAFERVTVRASGHVILSDVDLAIEAGDQVAILGVSGAGKSSLVSVLLGWHRPASGQVLVDNVSLDTQQIVKLRRETAWVDPAVQLWNRSLLENLRYGAVDDSLAALGDVISPIGLQDLLEKLPDGLQTPLGEGGALVSGGEGQRVRLGRAMARSDARLAILDEPFRGLDRERRKQLLSRARSLWRHATLFCITHDISETMGFDRVVIIEGGRIAEDGAPAELAQRSNSRFRAMLAAEAAVNSGLWGNRDWRRFRLDGGQLVEDRQSSSK